MKPYVPIFSRTPARMTDPAVGASTWASGSQVWNGNIGTLIANPRKNARKTHDLQAAGICGAILNSSVTSKVGALPRPCRPTPPGRRVVEVEGQDAEQHQHRADQGVKEELDRRVELPRPAPDADQEVHRDQHHFPEDVEQEEVERHEDADHAGLQQQQQDVVFLLPVGDRRERASTPR